MKINKLSILLLLLLVVFLAPCTYAKHLPQVMTAEEIDAIVNGVHVDTIGASTYISFSGSVTGTLYCHNLGPGSLDAISGTLDVYEQQEDGDYMRCITKHFSDTLLPAGSTKLTSYYKAYLGARLAYITTVKFTEDGQSSTSTGGRYYPN